MKQPISPLPWSVIEDNIAGLYSKKGCFLVTDEDYKSEDIQYIVEAANNYPKVIESLKEALDQLESWNPESEDTFTIKRVKEFLKSINEL